MSSAWTSEATCTGCSLWVFSGHGSKVNGPAHSMLGMFEFLVGMSVMVLLCIMVLSSSETSSAIYLCGGNLKGDVHWQWICHCLWTILDGWGAATHSPYRIRECMLWGLWSLLSIPNRSLSHMLFKSKGVLVLFAQEDGALGLALIPIEDDAFIICGHLHSPRVW